MNPKVSLEEDGFTLAWSSVRGASEYLVYLERCDRQHLATGGVECERVVSDNVTVATTGSPSDVANADNSIQLKSEKVLDLCQYYYNVRIDAFGAGGARMIFRETAVFAKYAFFLHKNTHLMLEGRCTFRSYSKSSNLCYNHFVTKRAFTGVAASAKRSWRRF